MTINAGVRPSDAYPLVFIHDSRLHCSGLEDGESRQRIRPGIDRLSRTKERPSCWGFSILDDQSQRNASRSFYRRDGIARNYPTTDTHRGRQTSVNLHALLGPKLTLRIRALPIFPFDNVRQIPSADVDRWCRRRVPRGQRGRRRTGRLLTTSGGNGRWADRRWCRGSTIPR